MSYQCKIITDSIDPNGDRLTTMQITYPRIVHSEFMTHRQFSRNAASSRAIPIAKMIEAVKEDPFIPVHWGANQKGMQAAKELSDTEQDTARKAWLDARNAALRQAYFLHQAGLHKQIVNRVLEPFAWITVVVTSNQWSNFFHLRCNPEAQPELQKIARMMEKALDENVPTVLHFNDWHLPYSDAETRTLDIALRKKISVARCARVSYLTQEGERDHDKDIELYERLYTSGHWSPFEHVATTLNGDDMRVHWRGNFAGNWAQLRKMFYGECK